MIGASPLNEELRRMPADQLAETADYIQTLIEERRLSRAEMKPRGSLALDSSVVVRHMGRQMLPLVPA